MSQYKTVCKQLKHAPKTWLVTDFIGSSLLQNLVKLNQKVMGLDNFARGYHYNSDKVQKLVMEEKWPSFKFYEGDIRNLEDCHKTCANLEHILHQTALHFVPRCIVDLIIPNAANITGFLKMLRSTRNANVSIFTHAASSSIYCNHPVLPKVEENIANPLSSYAVTKYVNELYLDVFAKTYSFKEIGLRYFNVLGECQDPNGAYIKVIPKLTSALIADDDVFINGDTSRDFCFIENTVRAHILAATTQKKEAKHQVYNVAVGDCITLNDLFNATLVTSNENGVADGKEPVCRESRVANLHHSQVSIEKIKLRINSQPSYAINIGIKTAVNCYLDRNY